MNFSKLLGPTVDGAVFVREYCGSQCLHIPGEAGKFRELMGWRDVNRILECSQRFQPDTIMLWKNSGPVPREIYTKSSYIPKKRMFATEVQGDLLARELRNGATLAINRVDELHPPVTELAREMEAVFEAGVQINLYASWGNVNGFARHFDEHDSFILQLEGRKGWRVWQPTVEYPLVFTGGEPHPEDDELWADTIVDGDLLYVPRGYWHLATPCGEPSLHLTVGIRPVTGVDLLRWLAERLSLSAGIRKDFPRLGDAATTKSAYMSGLRAAVSELLSDASVSEFFAHMRSTGHQRPCFSLPWSATQDVVPPFPSGYIKVVPSPVPDITTSQPDGDIFLSIRGKTFSWNRATRPLLQYVLKHKTVSVVALYETFSGRFSEEQVRSFLIGATESGLIVVDR